MKTNEVPETVKPDLLAVVEAARNVTDLPAGMRWTQAMAALVDALDALDAKGTP